MAENTKNPNNFVYEQGVNVEIPGEFFSYLMRYVGGVIDENSKSYYTDRFKFVNTESGKEVKKPKQEDIDSGKVVKVTDIESTLGSEAKFYRNRTALEGIHILNIMNGYHMVNIEEGKATSIDEIRKKMEQSQEKPELVLEP